MKVKFTSFFVCDCWPLKKSTNEQSEDLRTTGWSHFIPVTSFCVGLTNSYSKITNNNQLKKYKYKINIDFKITI